jgi:hypothetical protein
MKTILFNDCTGNAHAIAIDASEICKADDPLFFMRDSDAGIMVRMPTGDDEFFKLTRLLQHTEEIQGWELQGPSCRLTIFND